MKWQNILKSYGIKEEIIMLFNKETTIAMIDYRINLLRARGETMNEHLIAKLERNKRIMGGKEQCQK